MYLPGQLISGEIGSSQPRERYRIIGVAHNNLEAVRQGGGHGQVPVARTGVTRCFRCTVHCKGSVRSGPVRAGRSLFLIRLVASSVASLPQRERDVSPHAMPVVSLRPQHHLSLFSQSSSFISFSGSLARSSHSQFFLFITTAE